MATPSLIVGQSDWLPIQMAIFVQLIISSLVAPVTINKESIVGAGSVITKNVTKNSLALTRSLQTETKNYKRKKK